MGRAFGPPDRDSDPVCDRSVSLTPRADCAACPKDASYRVHAGVFVTAWGWGTEARDQEREERAVLARLGPEHPVAWRVTSGGGLVFQAAAAVVSNGVDLPA